MEHSVSVLIVQSIDGFQLVDAVEQGALMDVQCLGDPLDILHVQKIEV